MTEALTSALMQTIEVKTIVKFLSTRRKRTGIADLHLKHAGASVALKLLVSMEEGLFLQR